jgi:hypothetical protein
MNGDDLSKPRHMRSMRLLAAERLAIKEIIDRLMERNDPIGQCEAAISLARICPDSEFVRSAVIELDGLVGLCSLLSSEEHEPTSEARVYACRALASLCLGGYPGRLMDPADVQYQICVVHGVLPHVVSGLLACGDPRVKPTAEEQLLCAACATLTAALVEDNAANQQAFAAAGVLEPLVVMLGSPSQSFIGIDLPAHAAAAIAGLSAHPFHQGTIATHGALGPLVNNLVLGAPTTCEQCALALLRLLRGNPYNKRAVLRMGGVDALVGSLIAGATPEASFYAGRALVHLATRQPDGAKHVYRRLWGVLCCRPNAVDFQVPGHPALLRKRLTSERLLVTMGTLASIPFEPLRACLAYELSPLPLGVRARRAANAHRGEEAQQEGVEDDEDDESDAEEQGTAVARRHLQSSALRVAVNEQAAAAAELQMQMQQRHGGQQEAPPGFAYSFSPLPADQELAPRPRMRATPVQASRPG